MSNYELYEHKRSDIVKWVLTLVAFIVVGVMLAGIICGWIEKKVTEEEQAGVPAYSFIVGNGEGNRMSLTSVRNSAIAGESVTITATVEPDNLQLHTVGGGMGGLSARPASEHSPSDFIQRFTHAGESLIPEGNCLTYTYGDDLELLDLKVTLTGEYAAYTYETTFVIAGYTNTSTLTGMNVSGPQSCFKEALCRAKDSWQQRSSASFSSCCSRRGRSP